MKIGMNLLLWTDQPRADEHGELLERIKQWGFDGVEIPIDSLDKSGARELGQKLDELELGRTTISALDAAVADPSSREKNLRNAAIQLLKEALLNTKELGADLLCGPLFQGLGKFSGKAPEDDERRYVVETLREVGEFAHSLGIKIALEPLNRFEMYMANTLADGTSIVRAIDLPNVGLLADTHHGNIEEADTADAWRNAAANILHVHISENNRGVPGSGHAIPADIFRTLKDISYDGWVTIEAFGQTVPGLISRLHLWRSFSEHNDDAARKGIAFIRSQLKG